jgi:hypothetical protein
MRRSITPMLATALATLAACTQQRALVLTQSLPAPCATTPVNELRVEGLGDFPPAPAQSASLEVGAQLSLDLPRGARVVTLEGLGAEGDLAIGRSAPFELPQLWQGARSIPLAYGPPDTMCATAPLAYARGGHQATLLDDGSVLLTGGVDNDGAPVLVFERYLPSGDATSSVARFEPVGQGANALTLDPQAVLGHATTRLSDGRVLLTGGAPAADGEADGIAYAGALVLATDGTIDGPARVLGDGSRAFHASTLLPDGRVLLTGGCSELSAGLCAAGHALATAEIYDPSADAFTAGVSLVSARSEHSAFLRDDGLVVLVGGHDESGAALEPELYDPDEERGSIVNGPTGAAAASASGLVFAVNDASGPSAETLAWSALDEAPVSLPQLPSARDGATLTALEDGAMLIAGGGDAAELATTSLVLTASGTSTQVGGFSARGHTATRLLDGSVLIAGGGTVSGQGSTNAVLFLHSLVGPFETPPTISFDGSLVLSPNRPGRISVSDGALVVVGATTAGPTPDAFALLAGPEVAGPNDSGFTVSLLAGTSGAGEAAILFGDPADGAYLAIDLLVGAAARIISVTRDRPGLLDVSALSGCTASTLAASDLPNGSFASWTLTARKGRVTLANGTHTLLRCSTDGKLWPTRGAIALGAFQGSVRYDNVELER